MSVTTLSKVVTGQVFSGSEVVEIHSVAVRYKAFCELLAVYKISERRLATLLGVSKTFAHKLRIGEAPITSERINQLPPHLIEAYRKAITGPLQLNLPLGE